MSTFRRPKPEAAQQLYSLPRRELQALCKVHGIPANRTNTAMADALSSFVPFQGGKAAAGPNSLGVAKTTIMKLKVEKKTEIPETSLATFILSGKVKPSPLKRAEKPKLVESEEIGFVRLNTTPLKRGLKRAERPLQQLPEKSNVPLETRGVANQDRYGKKAWNSPKGRALTPRKRAAESFAVATARGRDARPPVPFSDLLSSPKKPPNNLNQDTTGTSAKVVKSRLGPQKQASVSERPALKKSVKSVSSGNESVDFRASVVEDLGPQEEHGMETVEISYTEIEFKDSALHKELLGVHERSTNAEEEKNLLEVIDEEQGDASENSRAAEFEYKDMALHNELFGRQQKSEEKLEESVGASEDLQLLETSDGTEQHNDRTRVSISQEDGIAMCNANKLPLQVTPCKDESNDDALDKELMRLQKSNTNAMENDVRREVIDDLRELVGVTSVKMRVAEFEYRDMALHNELFGRQKKSETISEESAGISERVNRSATPEGPEEVHEDRQQTATLEPIREDAAAVLSEDLPLLLGACKDAHIHAGHKEEEVEEDAKQQLSRLHHVGDVAIDNMLRTCSENVHMGSVCKLDDTRKLDQAVTDNEKADSSLSMSATKVVILANAKLAEFKKNLNPNPHMTPLTKIQNNIDVTLAKANSILEKLASWRADFEKKVADGYWEPKPSFVKHDVPAVVEAQEPLAEKVPEVDTELPSAKKAKFAKTVQGPQMLTVCEDVVADSEMPSSKKPRMLTETRDSSFSDKENQSEKFMEVVSSDRTFSHGKDKKKARKYEVLKDRSMNVVHNTNNETTLRDIKENHVAVMSLRSLRSQIKEKMRQRETMKPPLGFRQQGGRNMTH